MGKLIVIEGLDGSGKTTQTTRLYAELLERNIPCKRLKFPNYDEDTSALVKMYLGGELGKLEDISPYGASLFYTVDRYGSFLRNWKQDYLTDCVILCDRYTTSNVAHQMSKLPRGHWDDYLEWLEELEYRRVGLPPPNRVIYLDMQPETSRRLLSQRYAGDESKRDIHEANFAYLVKCREAALYGAKKLGWTVISCCDGNEPYSCDRIEEMIL
ncbi:MAG: thymidylate kinase, partial [Angelakisella sp.]